uniref:Uncharacterized protein n=1 Tax=Setaria italica TaxID=4555 RepID=K4ANM5_SETIT
MRPCGLCIQTFSTVAPARFDGCYLLRCPFVCPASFSRDYGATASAVPPPLDF